MRINLYKYSNEEDPKRNWLGASRISLRCKNILLGVSYGLSDWLYSNVKHLAYGIPGIFKVSLLKRYIEGSSPTSKKFIRYMWWVSLAQCVIRFRVFKNLKYIKNIYRIKYVNEGDNTSINKFCCLEDNKSSFNRRVLLRLWPWVILLRLNVIFCQTGF